MDAQKQQVEEHLLNGNCWSEEEIYACPACGPDDMCDVCHYHDAYRGYCDECEPCKACDERREF